MYIREFQMELRDPYSYQDRVVEHETFEEYIDSRLISKTHPYSSLSRGSKLQIDALGTKSILGKFHHPVLHCDVLHIAYKIEDDIEYFIKEVENNKVTAT